MNKNIKDTNFKDYPGQLFENKWYEFPKLYFARSADDKVRFWQIFVRLIKSTETQKVKMNWELDSFESVPTEQKYLNPKTDLPQNAIAQTWQEYGQVDGKLTRSAPKHLLKASYENTNRKDRQTKFTQALINARTLYNKKLDEGFVLNLDDIKKQNTNRLVPMALHDTAKKNITITYPCYVQRKLDGIRALTLYKNDDVIMYSRHNKDFTRLNSIRKQIKELYLKTNKKYQFDGEFYKHGKSLQQISGDVRNEESAKNNYLEFHIFDIINLEKLDEPFSTRLEHLNLLNDVIKKEKLDKLKIVETFEVKSHEELMKKHQQFLKEKYEGSIVRFKDSKYAISYTKEKRSDTTVKIKPTYDSEFEVVGFTEGKRGKDKGAIIWILKTDKGKQFTSVPKNTNYEERYKLYDLLKNEPTKFIQEYKGKMMKVEYQDLSKDGVPQRAKALAIRHSAD